MWLERKVQFPIGNKGVKDAEIRGLPLLSYNTVQSAQGWEDCEPEHVRNSKKW